MPAAGAVSASVQLVDPQPRPTQLQPSLPPPGTASAWVSGGAAAKAAAPAAPVVASRTMVHVASSSRVSGVVAASSAPATSHSPAPARGQSTTAWQSSGVQHTAAVLGGAVDVDSDGGDDAHVEELAQTTASNPSYDNVRRHLLQQLAQLEQRVPTQVEQRMLTQVEQRAPAQQKPGSLDFSRGLDKGSGHRAINGSVNGHGVDNGVVDDDEIAKARAAMEPAVPRDVSSSVAVGGWMVQPSSVPPAPVSTPVKVATRGGDGPAGHHANGIAHNTERKSQPQDDLQSTQRRDGDVPTPWDQVRGSRQTHSHGVLLS